MQIKQNYDPGWDFARLFNRANEMNRQGRYQSAIECYDQSLELKPNFADAWINRGSCKLRMGNYSGAIIDLDRAIELEKAEPPTDMRRQKLIGAYANRGMAKSLSGDLNGAFVDHSQSIELGPEFAGVYTARAISLIKLGDFRRAILDCRKARETDRGASRSTVLQLLSQLLHPEEIQAFERAWPDL